MALSPRKILIMDQPPRKILRINLSALGAIGKDEFDRTVTTINQSISNVDKKATDALNNANTANSGISATNANLVENYLKNTASVNGKTFKANNNAIVLSAEDLGTAPLRFTSARTIFSGTIGSSAGDGNGFQDTVTNLPESILGRTIMMNMGNAKVTFRESVPASVVVQIPPKDGVVHVGGLERIEYFSGGIGDTRTAEGYYLRVSNNGKTVQQLCYMGRFNTPSGAVLSNISILE